jgi:hypothetical protein
VIEDIRDASGSELDAGSGRPRARQGRVSVDAGTGANSAVAS